MVSKNVDPVLKVDKLWNESECPICYKLMIEPTKLLCNHRFCTQCMNQVLRNNDCCPLC